MSLSQRIKQGYLRLPAPDKAILVGGGLTMISALLPWYDSMNGYSVKTYIGLQGPMFLIGVLVLLSGGYCFIKMFLPLIGRDAVQTNFKSGKTALFLGGGVLLLLVLANSIFFHPDFGISVTHKATRFGMMTAFLGSFAMIVGGYFCGKKDVPVSTYREVDFQTTSPRQDYGTYQASTFQRDDYNQQATDMDARTKYKLASQSARHNLWQRQPGSLNNVSSPFSKLSQTEKQINERN